MPAGRVFIDGLGVGDVGNIVLRDRQHLSQDGLIIVVIAMEKKTGKILAGPDLISRGFVYVRESEDLMGEMRSELCKDLAKFERNKRLVNNKKYIKRHTSWFCICKNKEKSDDYSYNFGDIKI